MSDFWPVASGVSFRFSARGHVVDHLDKDLPLLHASSLFFLSKCLRGCLDVRLSKALVGAEGRLQYKRASWQQRDDSEAEAAMSSRKRRRRQRQSKTFGLSLSAASLTFLNSAQLDAHLGVTCKVVV